MNILRNLIPAVVSMSVWGCASDAGVVSDGGVAGSAASGGGGRPDGIIVGAGGVSGTTEGNGTYVDSSGRVQASQPVVVIPTPESQKKMDGTPKR